MELLVYFVIGIPILIGVYAKASGRGSIAHALGAVVLFVLAAGASMLALFLSYVVTQPLGPNDGAGALFLIAGMLISGLFALIFWTFFFSLLKAPAEPEAPAAALAGGHSRAAMRAPARDLTERMWAERTQALRKRTKTRAGLALVGALALVVALGVSDALERRPAHDAAIGCLFLTADESQVVSVDSDGTLKRWSTRRRGGYQGTIRNPALASATRIEAAAGEELLVFLPGQIALFAGPAAAQPTAVFDQALDAALAPGGDIVLAEANGIAWRAIASPSVASRRLDWAAGAKLLAASPSGEVSFLDGTKSLVTLRDNPARVVRRLPLAEACDRLVYSPSGSFLLLFDAAHSTFRILAAGSQQLEPGLPLAAPPHVGFIGPDTLVAGSVGLVNFDLGQRHGRPYWNEGISTNLLVASPRYERCFLASGGRLYMVGWKDDLDDKPGRSWSGERKAASRRLTHWRF